MSAKHRAADTFCLELFWNTSPDGALWIVDGTVQRCNPAAERLFRKPSQELEGSTLTELCRIGEDGTAAIAEETGTGALCTLTRSLCTDPAGELVIFRDVTEVRELEISLRERNGQLTSTIESIPFDFWMNDMDNRTTLQNLASRNLWGDQTGNEMHQVTDQPEILQAWEASNRRAMRGETVVDEITYTIGGRPRVFRNVVAPVRTEDEIIGILGLNIEITDLKDALSDRDRLLKELHHLLRNDLQIILSTMNLHITEKILTPEQVLHRVATQVQTICLVHDQLYSGGPIGTVDLSDVAVRLAPESRILEPQGPVLCPIEQAIPIALLLAELVSWVSGDDSRGSTIDIHRTMEREISFLIRNTRAAPGEPGDSRPRDNRPRDNQPGDNRPRDNQPGELSVIRGLVDQLNGTLTLAATPWVEVSVQIPYPFGPVLSETL